MIKKVFCVFAGIVVYSLGISQPVIIAPERQHPTSLMIFVDGETYGNVRPELDDYKRMLEQKEKLSVYVLVNDWKRPEEIVTEMRKISQRKPVPEGVVLIGDIPVVMVRNAQHMTSAFKMHETNFPIEQSSVASDRFYDDYDLKFRFLKADDSRKNWFYYELDEEGPQVVRSDIYSARIMSRKEGADKYAEIKSFLRKAVAARNSRSPLKSFTSFTGSAYNSESLTSWSDEGLALRELFPVAFKEGQARLLNFRMAGQMKFQLYTELQRPGSDLVLLSEHGDISMQYINNRPSGNDIGFYLKNLAFEARQAMRNAVKRGKDTTELKEFYFNQYRLDERWFEGAFSNDSLRREDSLRVADADIYQTEISKLNLQSKVVIFNACYNGSFHHADNIAASYIFNNGNTLVVHGNTVNVLQDKWTIEQLGLLNHGVRVGFWSMLSNTLESHLIGDPTWHFNSEFSDMNGKLITERSNAAFWKNLLGKDDPVLQSLALKQLFLLNVSDVDRILVNAFRSSGYVNVRMQCLKLLSSKKNEVFASIVPMAIGDQYELIRRKTAEWIAKCGNTEFIPLLVSLAIERPLDDRVVFSVNKSLELMAPEVVQAEVVKQLRAASYIYNVKELEGNWLDELKRKEAFANTTMGSIKDQSRTLDSRISAARTLRNYTYHYLVPEIISVASDAAQPELLRQNLIEALGWFSNSYQKELIMDFCLQIRNTLPESSVLSREAQQTISRLRQWTLH